MAPGGVRVCGHSDLSEDQAVRLLDFQKRVNNVVNDHVFLHSFCRHILKPAPSLITGVSPGRRRRSWPWGRDLVRMLGNPPAIYCPSMRGGPALTYPVKMKLKLPAQFALFPEFTLHYLRPESEAFRLAKAFGIELRGRGPTHVYLDQTIPAYVVVRGGKGTRLKVTTYRPGRNHAIPNWRELVPSNQVKRVVITHLLKKSLGSCTPDKYNRGAKANRQRKRPRMGDLCQ